MVNKNEISEDKQWALFWSSFTQIIRIIFYLTFHFLFHFILLSSLFEAQANQRRGINSEYQRKETNVNDFLFVPKSTHKRHVHWNLNLERFAFCYFVFILFSFIFSTFLFLFFQNDWYWCCKVTESEQKYKRTFFILLLIFIRIDYA